MKPFTPNSSDRELDELFQKAAGAHATAQTGKEAMAGKEAIWEKLEEKLDTGAKRTSRRRRWRFLFLALLLSGAIGFLTLMNTGIKTADQRPEKAASVRDGKKTTVATNPGKAAGRSNNLKGQTGKSAVATTSPSSRPTARSEAQHFVETGTKTDHTTEDLQISAEDYTPAGRYPSLPRLPYGLTKTIQEEPSSPELSRQEPSANTTDSMSGEPQQKEPPVSFSRWSIGFTAGPDWSGMKSGKWKAGVNGGLKLTYRFSEKWAVTTGLSLAKKLYDAPPGGYHPPDSGWQNYDVKQINAQCIVLDVPLNIEYTLWSHDGNHLLLGTGLSSFWMEEEKYTYRYKTPAGSWKHWTKEMYNQHHHLFSILNFSAGYQKDWRHFSLQVSPYLKVPLQGIGYGNVQLYGAGVHLTLQYRLK